ncbi:MAG: DUF5689 domain-containing protein [Ferruginibacter sp.]
MKNIIPIIFCLTAALGFWGCEKDKYPGGTPYNEIALLDLRGIYNGTPVTLTKEIMFGGDKLRAMVVSDHRGGNSPEGLVMVQEKRRLGLLRGIAINLGAAAGDYLPGDSLQVMLEGATLTRENGILQLKDVDAADITKISTGNPVTVVPVKANLIIASPDAYESTLLAVANAGFDASYPAGTTYSGNRIINDGFGNITLHTEPETSYANDPIPFLSNFSGIIVTPSSDTIPQLWPRSAADITVLAATAPKIAPVVITGYLVDPSGTDANYEYIQLMATKDINFASNNFSVVTTNNAGASTPTGFPSNGWATGDLRTYKINITSGSVIKGQYFYVGANKNIWGSGSTDISSAFWVSKMYASVAGDGFGTATTNLLANSGNAAGIAVFDLTAVTNDTIPIDVIFYGGAGSLYTAGPPERGYKIMTNDYYNVKDPISLAIQPYFNMGSNTNKLAFPAATYFSRLGGKYNIVTGRWTNARTLTGVPLTATSTRAEIEGATTLEQ